METETQTFLLAFEERMKGHFIHIEKRFDNIESRFNALEKRFDTLEKRFDALELRFDILESRFTDLEKRVLILEQNQHDMQEHLQFLVETMGGFVDDAKKTIKSHEVRLVNIEARMQYA